MLFNDDIWDYIKKFIFTPQKCFMCVHYIKNKDTLLPSTQMVDEVSDGKYITRWFQYSEKDVVFEYCCRRHYPNGTPEGRKKTEKGLYMVVRWEVGVKVIGVKGLKTLISRLSDNELMRIYLLNHSYRQRIKTNRALALGIVK